MAFVDTQPAPINRGDPTGEWARFRVRNPRKQLATLREICRNDTPLVVGAPGGLTVQVALWSVDDINGRLHFKVDADSKGFKALSLEPELWAAAYVEDAKVQFALLQVSFSAEGNNHVLVCDIPEHMYRLPRRQSVRVRRNDADGPKVRFAHPLAPDLMTSLRVLDVSASGCALLRPADGLNLPLGMLLRQVEIELDDDTILFSDLLVHHVTVHSRRDRSARVGCEWRGMPAAAQERLHQWIQHGRRRRDLMSLSLG